MTPGVPPRRVSERVAGLSKTGGSIPPSVEVMTTYEPFIRTVVYRAHSGHREQLCSGLLDAATAVGDAPGCELWLVHQDNSDPDRVHVTEMWASPEHAQAPLEDPNAADRIGAILAVLAEAPMVSESTPLGGARMPRGEVGASAFRILDAPDLSRDAELLGRYSLDSVAAARYVREQLRAVQSGLTHYQLAPGCSQGWAHRHRVAEEIYVAIAGEGWIEVDAQSYPLDRLTAVRVAPASTRELKAGAAGLEVLAFGPHYPGDGEMVARPQGNGRQ